MNEIETARRYAAALPRLATTNQSAVASAIASYATMSIPPQRLGEFPYLAEAVRAQLTARFSPAGMHGVAEAPAEWSYPPG